MALERTGARNGRGIARLLANLRITAKTVAHRLVAPRYGSTDPLYKLLLRIQNCYGLARHLENLVEELGPPDHETRTTMSMFSLYYAAADAEVLPPACEQCEYELVCISTTVGLRCRICSPPRPLRPLPRTATAKVCRGILRVLGRGDAFLNATRSTRWGDAEGVWNEMQEAIGTLRRQGGEELRDLPRLADELSIRADWVDLAADQCDDMCIEDVRRQLSRAKLIEKLVALDGARLGERGHLDALSLDELQAMWEGHPSQIVLDCEDA